MIGRCRHCRHITATRLNAKKVGALGSDICRVGFVQEAEKGELFTHEVLVCLPCLVNMLPANVTQ